MLPQASFSSAALDPACRGMIGVVPSQNTPFDADGAIDLAAVRRVARASIEARVAGMLVLAVASENRSLTIDERRAVGEAFVDETGGRVPIIAAVSAPDIATAVALTKAAVASGVDGVCYQAPNGVSRDTLDEHVARICDLGPKLFMLQDLDWTGPGLSMEDIGWLFERHERFRAIKIEANPAGPKYTLALETFGGRLHVSGGWAAAQMIEALARGVHAFMPTAMDYIYVGIYTRFASGDVDGARALFERMLPFIAFSNQHIDVSIRFYKRVRQLDGIFPTAECRAPTPTLDAFQSAILDQLAARAVELDREIRSQPQKSSAAHGAPKSATHVASAT
ncbi:MAG: dihydrodipicolinate synthase family protein [Beijerinckiaceae bacterium]